MMLLKFTRIFLFRIKYSLLILIWNIILSKASVSEHFEFSIGKLQEHSSQFNDSYVRSKNSNLFEPINEWKYLDFKYASFVERQYAISNREFVPENNLPLGIDIHRDRLFITTPRWKDGVPASLSTVPYPPKENSPALSPYPNWSFHGSPYNPDCSKLISVYRTAIDKCNRLWLIDSGIVNATVKSNQICPPKIVAFDLSSDLMIISYELPPLQVKQDSLHSNIVVNVGDKCENTHAFVSDVWRFGITVYSLAKNRSWRVTNYNFYPNPMASDFKLYDLNFQWLDGVFGMTIFYDQISNQRLLYFHPMASFKEFVVSLDLLIDESLWINSTTDVAKYFNSLGDRGLNGQSSTSGISKNGVMFYTQVHRDNIGCWDTSKPYIRANLAMLVDGNSSTSLIQFPNDLKVDNEEEQGVWVMSNRLPIFLYSQLDYTDINFRILRADAYNIIAGTICNPSREPNKRNKSTIVSIEEGQCY